MNNNKHKQKKIEIEYPPNSILNAFEAEKANNLHKDILKKINNILHRKTYDENFINKLKKSTVLCFDDLSINDNEAFIDDKIDEYLEILKEEVGNFVDLNPENKTKEINYIGRHTNVHFHSKNFLNKAFNRGNIKNPNQLKVYNNIKSALMKKGLPINMNNINSHSNEGKYRDDFFLTNPGGGKVGKNLSNDEGKDSKIMHRKTVNK